MSIDRLTALDSSFVWFERPGMPIHVGAVATFEAAPLFDPHGNLRLAELRERFDARLDALPRLRRRLVPVPFGLDRPGGSTIPTSTSPTTSARSACRRPATTRHFAGSPARCRAKRSPAIGRCGTSAS